jgi:hypothetical protein
MSDAIILEGYNTFKKRLEPAVLLDHKVNSNILGAWCVANGFNLHSLTTPREVADALYRATNAEVARLLWTVKPKKLQILDDKGIRNAAQARAQGEEFTAKVRKSEADTEYGKTQVAALRQINSLIDGIQFKDASGTRIAHGKTESVKEVCRKHLAKAQVGKRDLRQVAQEITKYRDDEFEKAEKAAERL